MTYRIERYSAMGHDPTTLVYAENIARLQTARALVRQYLHVARLTKARQWFPPDDMGGPSPAPAGADSGRPMAEAMGLKDDDLPF